MRRIIALILILACFAFVSSAEEHRVLRQGSRGEDVRVLQARLIELGYLNDIPDGVYGINTENAVAAFQEESGLDVNGIADLETQNALLVEAEEPDFILNTKSKKFHRPSCNGVETMSEANKKAFFGTREEALEIGYTPCGMCHP